MVTRKLDKTFNECRKDNMIAYNFKKTRNFKTKSDSILKHVNCQIEFTVISF